MRILVMSYSHGDYNRVRRAVMAQNKAEVIIHCGDGEDQIDNLKRDFPEKAVYAVRGNCDWGSTLPLEQLITLEGKRIMFTHGHIYSVKSGYYRIEQEARSKGADILLFGHTHLKMTEYEDGLYIMNPGSIGYYGASYGIIDITPQGIMMNTVNID